VGTWEVQEVDLRALYAEAGWEEPPHTPAVYRGLDAEYQLIWLRLFVAAGTGSKDPISAYFGPVEQDYRVKPQTRMSQTLDNPTSFYLRLAEKHVRDRNYARAMEAYQQALALSPGDRRALEGVEQIRQHPDWSLQR
jgi:hypothetical protein